jgi:hypothetical protein
MSTNITPSPSPSPAPDPKKRKPRPSAFADTLRGWEAILTAVADHASVLAPIDPHRAALADSLEKARQVKGIQDSYKGNKQRTTQNLKAIMVEGKDRFTRLRGAIRAELGLTTEQLSQFGIPPLRRRPPRHNPDATTPVPALEVQTTKVVRETE